MKIIKKISKKELKDFLYEISREDKQLYNEMNSNNGFGIFQFSGNTALGLVNDIKPENFEEMVAINSMARPGTIVFAPEYNANKKGDKAKYPKAVHELLSESRGIILFQEQIMLIFHKIGGFSLENTNMVRGLLKKLGKADKKKEDLEKWDKQVGIFIKGAIENGISEKQAKDIANDLIMLSSYSFNKCFSGDSVLAKDNWRNSPLSLREIYNIKNNSKYAKDTGYKSLHSKYKRKGYGKCYSLNNDDRLRLNNIVDIYYQGIRPVYKITLEDGRTIKVTSNHKFPVSKEKIIKTIDDGLVVGDELFVNGGYEPCDNKYNFSDYKTENRIFKSYEGEGFKSGEKNSAFINGEFIKFKEHREALLKSANGICNECNKKSVRLECHHKLFNRTSNDILDLEILCPSCHKKKHYDSGRTKKGDKGLLTKLVKIINIEYIGEEDVYDVEMEHPYHTLCVNDIVASNSHAMAYTYVGIQTLYLSRYFRKYFYASTLSYEATKKDALRSAYDNCSNFGFKILPPDVNKSYKNFTTLEDNGIIFGLNEIKNIGEKPIETIISNRPYKSVLDFILKTYDKGVTKTVVSSLVSSGCFDSLINGERKHYEKIIEKFYEIKKSTKVKELIEQKWNQALEETPYVKTTNEDYVTYEKELLSHNFFHGNFSSEEKEKIDLLYSKGYIDKSFDDVKESKATSRVPVYISKFRTHVDKNKNEMAFIEAEDMNGKKASFPVFASYWKFIKEKFSGEGMYVISLYRNQDNQIMFGSKGWVKDENKPKLLYGFRGKVAITQ